MTCFVVLDTNVLVSALLSEKDDAATVCVLEMVLKGELTPVYSSAISDEYREVLLRKKFGFSVELVEFLLETIKKGGISVEPEPSGVKLTDMKDLPFYEVALEMRGSDAFLVTGNTKHFPDEAFIVTPRELLTILGAERT